MPSLFLFSALGQCVRPSRNSITERGLSSAVLVHAWPWLSLSHGLTYLLNPITSDVYYNERTVHRLVGSPLAAGDREYARDDSG